MDLSCLLPLIEQRSEFIELRNRLDRPEVAGQAVVVEAARPHFIAALYRRAPRPLLIISPDYDRARRLQEQLQSWCPAGAPLYFFPETDSEVEGEIMSEATRERLRSLAALAGCAGRAGTAPVVVTPAAAAAGQAGPRDVFASACLTLKTGMESEPRQLGAKLHDIGYEVETTVDVPGAVSHRGGIVDFYSPDSLLPVRVEFLGNRVESLRFFDPKTQRSQKPVAEASAVPAREAPDETASVLDYLPGGGLLIIDSPEEAQSALDEESWERLRTRVLQQKRRLMVSSWTSEGAAPLPYGTVPSWNGKLDQFVESLGVLMKDPGRIVIVSHQARRLSEFLGENNLPAAPLAELCAIPLEGSLTLLQGSLDEGWSLAGSLRVITDKEIFGFVKQRRQVQKRPIHWQQFLSQLSPGDYIVHVEHGIGRFTGTVRQSHGGGEREYLVLEYSANDKLYVPVDRIDRVNRYIGAGDQPPALNRLGTQEWMRTKKKVKQAVEDIARDLLKLYAAREATPGHAFSPDTLWQKEMEAAFPYIETPDQLQAVLAVKEDMEKPRAMDRLICGDVGYGKTEVALRAAFKAVMDGKQVAILVPTTILAQQHFMTFKERLQAFPVKVAMLSRFCSDKEQDETVVKLGAGTVDICIGTHRLLQKDVAFKDLGLVVIDEEQRFGVVHKERLKQMKREVDVLTLSATPIPRTLYMSMVGVKDMSAIETPPDERLPIKTHVGDYDEELIRRAVKREMERDGQVFVVHNRVQTIGGVADKIRMFVPEARIAVAHGQMPEEQLEEIMTRFAARENDVLVSTTIIESGLDMPNVNTLIVTDADRLGLTQLHQLRGRVGRGVNRAAAYFLYPRGKRLTPQAAKRLKTIFEVTELGAGFGIALRDLEIRGAGNLLGVEQSGHIAEVGFDLYCRLLGEAVAELKATGKADVQLKPSELPSADLPVTAFIPEDYVADENARMTLYYRLTRLERYEQVGELRQEMVDRFGAPPPPAANLLFIMEARLLARDAGVDSIAWEKEYVVLQLTQERRQKPLSLHAERYRGRVRIGSSQVRFDTHNMRDPWQNMIVELLKELAASAVG